MKINTGTYTSRKVQAPVAPNIQLKKMVWILRCPWCKRYFQGDICPHCGYKK